jgi:hypothetical protein
LTYKAVTDDLSSFSKFNRDLDLQRSINKVLAIKRFVTRNQLDEIKEFEARQLKLRSSLAMKNSP